MVRYLRKIDLLHSLRSKPVLLLFVALAGTLLTGYWLTVLALLALFSLYFPMPKIFSSWFSRFVAAVILIVALIQIAAALQFLFFPHSKFMVLSLWLVLLSAGVHFALSRKTSIDTRKFISSKDVFALIGCLVFVVPMLLLATHGDAMTNIVQTADTQVVDSIAHFSDITSAVYVQNFNYKPGSYYPLGFHVAVAFIEYAFAGDVRMASWSTQAWIYFLQYIVFGCMLCYVFIYFVFAVMRLFSKDAKRSTDFVAAMCAAVGITLMHLLLFIWAGFLNYFYICAVLLMALQYLLADGPLTATSVRTKANYVVPVSIYLLLSAGAALSWPLFVPVTFIAAGLVIYLEIKDRRLSYAEAWPLLQVALAAVPCLMAVYFQLKYLVGGQLLDATGAVQNFNMTFLLLGVALTVFAYATVRSADSRQKIAATYYPYIVLIVALMLVQFFTVGEARYYLIKSAMMLEMLFLALLIAAASTWITRIKSGSHMLNLATVLLIVVFAVVATMGTVAKPFVGVRDLFPAYSQAPVASFSGSDSAAIARLGSRGELKQYNVTTLHYDAAGGQLNARIEAAAWANQLPYFNATKEGFVEARAFNEQFAALAYGGDDAQARIIEGVRAGVGASKAQGIPYYIVTDEASVSYLKQLFGNAPTYVQ